MDGIIINELSLNGQFWTAGISGKTECLHFTRHCRMPFHMEWGICSNKEVFLLRKPRQTRLYTIC